ncbi:MAG TPA: Stp1/IreP family PP2C-type Ser/Thr phosphatase [Pyrinomonadaceae bacterium]|jgi:protein phosphatase|nr:Stp1/IreP family PP2C-type Ser/Thr phosphatase [Pyrinomonadaceae bacterium]
MKEPLNDEVNVEAAVVTDRGLSEKRPLNEDSFLADEKRRIFAVADGVGGAQAGEVASRTAMEVLDEAFRHQVDGSDIEDLMEIAIQRANASIHRMAQEHPKLSTMATTVVALHLDGHTATIGHVGDSRLYRLTPDGQLHRETRDHSVVEEEVRAGRMTQEQAANHPSRNVISRALGAEDGVEVDMNTIEVEDGTAFLLCSDGITRHIPDKEISELLSSAMSLEEVCDEMKRRCYERGAEDNLTAVIVRVGATAKPSVGTETLDRTIDSLASTASLARTLPGNTNAPSMEATVETAPVQGTLQPASRTAFPSTAAERDVVAHAADGNSAATTGSADDEEVSGASRDAAEIKHGPGGGSKFARALVLIIIGALAGAAAAHYGKMFYQQRLAEQNQPTAAASPSPVTAPPEDPAVSFDRKRREVDSAPSQWLLSGLPAEMTKQNIVRPEDSTDPDFLYLYGRALLLTGEYDRALGAFELASSKLEERNPGQRTPQKVDVRLARAAAALMRPANSLVVQPAMNSLNEVVEKKQVVGSP